MSCTKVSMPPTRITDGGTGRVHINSIMSSARINNPVASAAALAPPVYQHVAQNVAVHPTLEEKYHEDRRRQHRQRSDVVSELLWHSSIEPDTLGSRAAIPGLSVPLRPSPPRAPAAHSLRNRPY